jgi:hypothetical protein
VGALVIVLFASAFCEAQPFVLDTLAQTSSASFIESALSKITKISALLAPVGAIIALGFRTEPGNLCLRKTAWWVEGLELPTKRLSAPG